MTNVVNSFAEVTVGSVQQSILGVFCIVAAFVLGQYIRTHPSPTSVELERLQQAAVAPAPQFAIRSGIAADQSTQAETPRLPAPSAGFSAATSTTEAQPASNVVKVEPVETYKPAERTIDIPDFSKLAASFENTPLALPQQSIRQQIVPAQQRRPDVATHSGSFYIRPATEPQQPELPPLETRSFVPQTVPEPTLAGQNFVDRGLAGMNLAGPNLAGSIAPIQNAPSQRAFVGSPPEPVAPPQPTDIYQIRERTTSFRRESFQPRLIADSNTRELMDSPPEPEMSRNDAGPTRNQSRRRRISLAPPEPDGTFVTPEVPELVVEIPDVPEPNRAQENQLATYNANHASNQLHSYYDVDMSESPRSVLDRSDFQRSAVSTSPETNRTNRRIPQSNRRIPFGLNEQGRRELTRIRDRQQTNIPLQTDRFSLHTTQAGDTLQSLSTEHYGKPDYYLDIYLANQQTLRNPAVIPAGIQIRIPQYDQ